MHMTHLDVMHAHEVPTVVQVLFKITVLKHTVVTVFSQIDPFCFLVFEISIFRKPNKDEVIYSRDTQTPE